MRKPRVEMQIMDIVEEAQLWLDTCCPYYNPVCGNTSCKTCHYCDANGVCRIWYNRKKVYA